MSKAGSDLGLRPAACARELDRQISTLPTAVEQVQREVLKENTALKPEAAKFLASEIRLIGVIKYIIIPEMINKVSL